MNLPVKKGETYAEYWLGTHNRGGAEIEDAKGGTILLKDYIQAYPKETLGEKAMQQFGDLPWLLKILDVKEMLSIQVHPSKANAEKEFESENQQGIELIAPERNYKDDNHKPELDAGLK